MKPQSAMLELAIWNERSKENRAKPSDMKDFLLTDQTLVLMTKLIKIYSTAILFMNAQTENISRIFQYKCFFPYIFA